VGIPRSRIGRSLTSAAADLLSDFCPGQSQATHWRSRSGPEGNNKCDRQGIRSALKICRLPKAIFDSSRRCLRNPASRSSKRRKILPARPAPQLSASPTEIAPSGERFTESTTGPLIHAKYVFHALFALRELTTEKSGGLQSNSLIQMTVLDPVFPISRFCFVLLT
jgi:hypothetical protein